MSICSLPEENKNRILKFILLTFAGFFALNSYGFCLLMIFNNKNFIYMPIYSFFGIIGTCMNLIIYLPIIGVLIFFYIKNMLSRNKFKKIIYVIVVCTMISWPYLLSVFGYLYKKYVDKNNYECNIDTYSNLINRHCINAGFLFVLFIMCGYLIIAVILFIIHMVKYVLCEMKMRYKYEQL